MSRTIFRSVLPAVAAFTFFGAASFSLAQIRIVNYNTLDGPTTGVHDNFANMTTIFGAISTQSVNGIAKRPDVIVLQEQTATSASNLAAILNALPGSSGMYTAVTPSGQANDDRQAFVYDRAGVSLVTINTVATGEIRPVLRGQFQPVGYTAAGSNFYVYGGHLMASDAAGRANQTAAARANANALGSAHVIYTGDFNMDSNSETAWVNLVTGAGEGLAVDPLNPSGAPQTWTNNGSFANIHTQSTRVGATPDMDGGATGGMDDRFDVQLLSQEFLDGEGLSFINGSYRAFGNDGLHFNKAINASPTIPLGATVANALWDASDHLPVVADYQLPAKLGAAITAAAPPRVIQGASATATVQVTNTAPVAVAAGADELDYVIATTGTAGGATTGSVNAGGATATATITLNTATPGNSNGSAVVSTTSQAAQGGSQTFNLSTLVLSHAQPSVSADSVVTSRVIDFGIRGRGESVPAVPAGVFNIAASAFGAGLDIDSITAVGDTSRLVLTLTAGAPAVDAGASRSGIAVIDSSAVGQFGASYSILTSDENIPGEANFAAIDFILTGRVAVFGDATLDNTVNINDFAVLASNFGAANQTWQQGDFNHDGTVTISDFALLAANFNTTAAELPRSAAVPEPVGAASVSLATLLYRRRRA